MRNALLLITIAGTASAALGADDLCCWQHRAGARPAAITFDANTGRDLMNYPPDRIVDHQHMRLVIDIPDMNTARASVVQTLTVTAIGKPVDRLTLDAHLLEISSVTSPGRTVAFEHDGHTLSLRFDPPLAPEAAADIITTYTINDPPEGLVWTPESPTWPGRPPQLHTQGQTETNSFWFPCHDFPNERLTTELIVTVPAGFTASANGRLAERTGGATAGRETFHWVQDKPHVNYLVSLIVGKFDIVDVAGTSPRRRDALRPLRAIPMPVYVPPGRGTDVAHTYGRTAEMVGLFERLTGEAYPWDRYAQLVVWNFGAGGMENTSATTMYDTAILSKEALPDGDLDGLISHELAHQWFGDLITCKSWEHIWLNEGFATYLTALWMEHRDGPDGYAESILKNFDGLRGSDRAEAPDQWPMVRKEYKNSWEVFGGPSSPYPRGASTLHMLRARLGDEVFFRALAVYVDRFKYKTAETADFRRVMEEVSGESLEQFFQQWCMRPGMPDIDIGIEWAADTRELVVTARQTQRIDGYNPAYEFDLPIAVVQTAGEGTPVIHRLPVRGREATARFALEAEPAIVAVDPSQTVLSRAKITQPTARWTAQATHGPTLPARVQALRALGQATDEGSLAALRQAADDSSLPALLRSESFLGLKVRSQLAALLDVADGQVEPVDPRVALLESIAELAAKPEADSALRERALKTLVGYTSDPSERTRAAAFKAFGTLKALDQSRLLQAALDQPSQHDRVRQAALEALGELNAPGTLAPVARYAMPGTLSRTRPIAIAQLPKLASQDAETAYRILALILRDRERRAWEAAGAALVTLGDQRARADLEKIAATKRSPGDQAKVAGWIAGLKEKAPDKPAEELSAR
jgi:aminopeptidase N